MKTFAVSLLAGLLSALALAGPTPDKKGCVLIVASSTDKLALKEEENKKEKTVPTGYYLDELAVPAQRWIDAGYEIVVATPRGTVPVVDESSKDEKCFDNDKAAYRRALDFAENHPCLRHPITLREAADRPGRFDAIFVPGGHAPMNDLMQDPDLGRLLRHFHEQGKPTALLCHGPVALLAAVDNPAAFRKALVDGDVDAAAKAAANWPYAGYRMTVFSNEEEQVVEEKRFKGHVPFYASDALRRAGARVFSAPKFRKLVVRHHELITGQNPASDHEIADALLDALKEPPPRRVEAQ